MSGSNIAKFSEEVLERARKEADRWSITLFPSAEMGTDTFFAQVRPLSVYGFGNTRGECVDRTYNALVLYMSHCIANGVEIPEVPQEERKTDPMAEALAGQMRKKLGLSKIEFLEVLVEINRRLKDEQESCKKAGRLYNTMTTCGNDILPDSFDWLGAHLASCEGCREKMKI